MVEAEAELPAAMFEGLAEGNAVVVDRASPPVGQFARALRLTVTTPAKDWAFSVGTRRSGPTGA
jgi:uncharacterized protein YqfA (UPF0365 family)